jgi:transcriptional regulator with XRE-family HTH domain
VKDYKESFSIKLKILRNTYGLSLAELAKILNMNTRGSLYDWENKRSFPSMENLIFLTNFFGVSLEWLLGRSSDIYTENSIYLGEIAVYTEINDDHINGQEVGKCYRADFLKAIKHISGKKYFDLDGLNITNYSSRIKYYSLPVRANLLVLLRLVPLGDLYWAHRIIICDKYSKNKRDILNLTKEDLRSAIGIKAENYKAPGKKTRERAINLVKLLMSSEIDEDPKMPIYDVEAVCHQIEQGTNPWDFKIQK